MVSNELHVRFEKLHPPAQESAPTRLVHYKADEIYGHIRLLYYIGQNQDIADTALIFSSETQQENCNVLSTLALAKKSLPGGAIQRPN